MEIKHREYHAHSALELSAERKGRITASAVGAILGLSKFATPDDVLRRMVREHFDEEKEFVGNIATRWGHDNEPKAIADSEQFCGKIIAHDFVSCEIDGVLCGASPDGVSERNYLVEIKCPYSLRDQSVIAADFLGEHPEYFAQTQWQMICADKQSCLFVVWTTQGIDFVRVERESDWLDKNMPRIKAFYDLYCETIADEKLYAPHLQSNKKEYAERDDDLFVFAALAYQNAIAEQKLAEEKVEEARKKLLEICTENTKGAGVTVCQSERKGAVDYKKIPQLEGVDVEQYRKKSTTVWTIKAESA
jgi:putative phage-type endonuclease